jgi:hypothetical protein
MENLYQSNSTLAAAYITSNHHAENLVNTIPPKGEIVQSAFSLPKKTGQILSIWAYVYLCETYLKNDPKRSVLPILLIVELSRFQQQQWVPLSHLAKLVTGFPSIQKPCELFNEAIGLGIIEIKQTKLKQVANAYVIRLTNRCQLVSQSHPNGMLMEKIRRNLNIYHEAHPRGSAIVCLLFSSYYLQKMGTPTDIAEVIYGSRDIAESDKIRKVSLRLHNLKIFHYQSLGMGSSTKAMISEVQ